MDGCEVLVTVIVAGDNVIDLRCTRLAADVADAVVAAQNPLAGCRPVVG